MQQSHELLRAYRVSGIARIGCGAALLVLPFLSACTGGLARRPDAAAASRYEEYAGQPVERFTVSRLDGWTPVSRSKLVLWDGASRAWLVTVWRSCPSLTFADVIGVDSIGRTVSRLDKIRVDGESCPISEIRPINVAQMRADRRLEAGRAKP